MSKANETIHSAQQKLESANEVINQISNNVNAKITSISSEVVEQAQEAIKNVSSKRDLLDHKIGQLREDLSNAGDDFIAGTEMASEDLSTSINNAKKRFEKTLDLK